VPFVRLNPCAKTQSATLTDFFVAQTITLGEQKISPKSDLKKKEFLPTPTIRDQTPSDYLDLVVVTVLVQNILE